MRGLLIFLTIVIYLFSLIYIESELVKLERKKGHLSNRLTTLKNQNKSLKFEAMNFSNLATIEADAAARGFVFPTEDDILGVVE